MPTKTKKRDLNRARTSTTAPHVVVIARAGTGKTTTGVQGLRGLMGMDPCMLPNGKRITPSDQQKAIWDAIMESQGAGSVCFVAFNRSIAAELKKRVPQGVSAKTFHGLGFGQVHKAWKLLKGDQAVCAYKTHNLIEELLGVDMRKLRQSKPELVTGTTKLVSLCKMSLTEPKAGRLQYLASHYDIDLNDSESEVFDLVPRVIEQCKDPERHGYIDYDDMVWLPVIHKLPVWVNDLLLVDEAQDLNPCQQELACMAGRRIMMIGDDRQAIYGFTGAHTDGINHMIERLSKTKRGCEVLKLTETRRCGKAIVAEANKIVEDFTAHESNGPGKVIGLDWDEDSKNNYRNHVKLGDMIICRVNAPLVSECFKFIADGKRAQIQGRDIGQGLIKLVDKMDSDSVPDLVAKLERWYEGETKKESAKKQPNENKLIALSDKLQCLNTFCEGRKSVDEVRESIKDIFTDRSDTRGILLSSGHKSKGLEADRVFFLCHDDAPCPHPMARTQWQYEQEMNLLYVIQTRAINELYQVR